MRKGRLLPLHNAAARNNVKKLKSLLTSGVNANVKDEWGRTALHWAAQENSMACAKALIAKGARIDALDETGFSSLDTAVGEGNFAFVKLLLNNGANPNKKVVNGSALHTAYAYERKSIIRLLIKYGASLKIKDKDGKTPEFYRYQIYQSPKANETSRRYLTPRQT